MVQPGVATQRVAEEAAKVAAQALGQSFDFSAGRFAQPPWLFNSADKRPQSIAECPRACAPNWPPPRSGSCHIWVSYQSVSKCTVSISEGKPDVVHKSIFAKTDHPSNSPTLSIPPIMKRNRTLYKLLFRYIMFRNCEGRKANGL